MKESRPHLWLSIKPRYVNEILAGSKHFELRRVAPKVEPGSIALLYASSPLRRLRGAVQVDEVLVMPVNEIWRLVKGACALDEREFRRYYTGKEEGVALSLGARWRATYEHSLEDLRNNWSGFQPAQSYAYISSATRQDDLVMTTAGGPRLAFSPRSL